jgi:hypothetical protein
MKGFQQKTSALSASSLFVILYSSAEDPLKERFFPIVKESQTAEIRERREDGKASHGPCFVFGRKCSVASASSAVDIFFIPGRCRDFYISQAKYIAKLIFDEKSL